MKYLKPYRPTCVLDKMVTLRHCHTSSETQGQIVPGARESLINGRKNMARRKVKNDEKSPWGQCLTGPVPNSRRRSDFWLGRKTQWHQSEVRTAATVWNWSGKTLSPGALLAVLYFSSRHIFRPFRLSLAPGTIYPWVFKDDCRIERLI